MTQDVIAKCLFTANCLVPFTLSHVVIEVHWAIVYKVLLAVDHGKLATNVWRGRFTPQCASDPAWYILH